MRYVLMILVVFNSGVAVYGQPKQDQNLVPVIGTSGDVEISSIRIERQTVSGAVKEADLTNMQIELWLTRKAETGKPGQFLVRIDELAPIEDDTGRVLSSTKRLDRIEFLKGEVSANHIMISRGKVGPIIGITVDAPSRQATKIKFLKGKATVSGADYARIQFDNLAAIEGKVLEHPKLKNFPIRASIKLVDGETEVTLNLPKQNARLSDWGLVEKGRPVPLSFETGFTRGYRGDHSKTASLSLLILEPNVTKTLEFEFKNIELP